MAKTGHPCATTTAVLRRRIQRSSESTRTLAARHGINRKTVLKWRHRTETQDAPCGRPQSRVSTVLTAEQEAIIVGFRKSSLLSLDDCLYALQDHIPHLTRASLHRCLVRHNVGRLPGALRASPKEGLGDLGRLRVGIGKTSTGEGTRYVFVAIDLASSFFFAKPYRYAGQRTVRVFLHDLAAALDFRIRELITAPDPPFAHGSGGPEDAAGRRRDLLQCACAEIGIRQSYLGPDPFWAEIQLQRTSRLLAAPNYGTQADLARYLREFADRYNFEKRLKRLRGLTPHQFICRAWVEESSLFHRSPVRVSRERPAGP